MKINKCITCLFVLASLVAEAQIQNNMNQYQQNPNQPQQNNTNQNNQNNTNPNNQNNTNQNNQNRNNTNQNTNNRNNRNTTNQRQNTTQYNTRTSAFINAGDTTQQMTNNQPYSTYYISRDDMHGFMNDPVLHVRDLRQDKNNPSADWEYMNPAGDIRDYTLIMLVNDKPVYMTNTGARLSEAWARSMALSRDDVNGMIFTNINVKDRKTGKVTRVPDLMFRLEPDVRVVYEIVDMPKIIYAGYDNKMRVGVNGNSYDRDITYEGNGVEVEKNANSDIITVRAMAPGTKWIYVKQRGRAIDTLELEAVEFPQPQVTFDHYSSGSMVTVNQLLNANARANSNALYPDISNSYRVTGYTVNVVKRKGKSKKFKVVGSKPSTEVTDYLVDNSKDIERIEVSDITVNSSRGLTNGNGHGKPGSVVYYLKK